MFHKILAILLIGISTLSYADMDAYKGCVGDYKGLKKGAELDMLVGIITFDVLGVFGAAKRQNEVNDLIMENCWPKLSPNEQEQIRKIWASEREQRREMKMPR